MRIITLFVDVHTVQLQKCVRFIIFQNVGDVCKIRRFKSRRKKKTSESDRKPRHTTYCKETIPKISKQIFPAKELRGHSPTIDLPILLQENIWTDPGNI